MIDGFRKSVAMQRIVIHVVQAALFAASAIFAFLLRFELTIPPNELRHVRIAIVICLVVKTIVFTIMTLDRGWWRYVSVSDLSRLAAGNVLASTIVFIIIFPLSTSFPRSIYILDMLICMVLTS